MKMDGHTHTQLCAHGSGEKTEKMIEKAIRLGFTDYCITEHAPLPAGFEASYEGPREGYETASLGFDQLEEYFEHAEWLKERFKGKINVHIGFETDYLPGFETEIKKFLDEYGPRCDTGILSVHFIQNSENKFHCIDFSPEDLAVGVKELLDDPQEIYHQYLMLVKDSIKADLGEYAPKRIGHMSLIKKYQDYFSFPEKFDERNMLLIEEILKEIKQTKRQLDFNLAGMYKPYCNEFYPGIQVLSLAKKMQIPLVYGSDAHGIEAVGQGYHLFSSLAQ